MDVLYSAAERSLMCRHSHRSGYFMVVNLTTTCVLAVPVISAVDSRMKPIFLLFVSTHPLMKVDIVTCENPITNSTGGCYFCTEDLFRLPGCNRSLPVRLRDVQASLNRLLTQLSSESVLFVCYWERHLGLIEAFMSSVFYSHSGGFTPSCKTRVLVPA